MLGLATSVAIVIFFIAMQLPSPTATAGNDSAIRFGMDVDSIGAQKNAGVSPDYAVVWVGPWTLKSGWGGVESAIDKAHRAGAVPTIHFYYWGNDISRNCIRNGCWSDIHDAHKSQNGWDRLATGLADTLRKHGTDKPSVIILETEFNKNDVRTWERLDGLLAEKAGYFDWALPKTKVVLGLGNWGHHEWGTWDRAAATSDVVGLQAMRASTQDSKSSYYHVVDHTIAGAKKIRQLFAKPVFVTDVALSSYPYREYADHQANVLRDFFDRMGALKAAGVEAFVYRTYANNPNYDTNEYYGRAEGGWGLAHADGRWKPAMSVWVDGVKAERGAGFQEKIEGERFHWHDNGARYSRGDASGGAVWNLWSNGLMVYDLWVPSGGHYAVNLRAGGSGLHGVGPHAVMQADGKQIFHGNLRTGGLHDYWAGFDTDGAETVRLVIHFTNDAHNGYEDRNLWVDSVTIHRG